jgi:choline dehydrogenase-like flavoprotein
LQRYSNKLPDRADVLVIGAGPSGAIVTHTLAIRGFSVVCLEQGDWVNPADYPANHPEWELLIQKSWHHDPNIRALPSDYPIETSQSDMSPVMFNAVGGSTIYFGAEWPRLMPSDFRVRSLDGVAADWPISYADLVPYYEEVDTFIGASGLGGDTAYPPGLDYPQPPQPIGAVGKRAVLGLNKLGWHWWPGSHAIPTYNHKLLRACARWGTCEWGCPEGAKASADLSYWPHAQQAGAIVVTGARVRKIETNRAGLAEGAIWIDRDGAEHLQQANVVVLCANGIGTPRLLLLSASPTHPDGLANSSGLVGRNLMLHPNCSVIGFYDEDLASHRGPAGHLVYSMQFYETDRSRGFIRGCKMHALPTPGPLNAIEAHRPLPYDELWGPRFHQVARTAERGILWAANIEDLPEEHNQVLLHESRTDADGVPAPEVRYRISENTRRNLKFTVRRMQEIHQASGATETFATELWTDQPGHLLGSARMGNDPATSVVDACGRAHDVPNLYIADGSIFVTAGSANPTCTISALALRVGKAIADNSRTQEVAS